MRNYRFLLGVVGLCLGLAVLPGCSQSSEDGAAQTPAQTMQPAHTGHAGPASLADAQAQSIARGKPILIDFFAEWCGPCKRFASESKNDQDIIAALDHVILYTVDAEKGDGVALSRKYGVRGYPTFVLVDANGATINQWTGYAKGFFLESLSGALGDLTLLDDNHAGNEG